MMVSLNYGDCIAFLKGIPSESIDCVITDPAYESLEKHRRVGTTTRLTKKWFPIFPNSGYPSLFEQLFRVLKKNAHCYIMCDQETMFIIKPIAEAAGFKFWKPLVWDKMRMGMGYHYRAQCEFVLFFEKGNRKLTDLSVTDVLAVRSLRGSELYPTEKPPELFEVLIANSTQPYDIVLDCFMGSGSVGVAAGTLGRVFIGNDLNKDAGGRLA